MRASRATSDDTHGPGERRAGHTTYDAPVAATFSGSQPDRGPATATCQPRARCAATRSTTHLATPSVVGWLTWRIEGGKAHHRSRPHLVGRGPDSSSATSL